jgi:hypothetical protein
MRVYASLPPGEVSPGVAMNQTAMVSPDPTFLSTQSGRIRSFNFVAEIGQREANADKILKSMSFSANR